MPVTFPGLTYTQRLQQEEEQKKAVAEQQVIEQTAAQRAAAERAAQQKRATATVIAHHAIPPATIVRSQPSSQPVQQPPQYSRSQSSAQRFLDIFTGGSGGREAAAAALRVAAASTTTKPVATTKVKATTTKAASTYKSPLGVATLDKVSSATANTIYQATKASTIIKNVLGSDMLKLGSAEYGVASDFLKVSSTNTKAVTPREYDAQHLSPASSVLKADVTTLMGKTGTALGSDVLALGKAEHGVVNDIASHFQEAASVSVKPTTPREYDVQHMSSAPGILKKGVVTLGSDVTTLGKDIVGHFESAAKASASVKPVTPRQYDVEKESTAASALKAETTVLGGDIVSRFEKAANSNKVSSYKQNPRGYAAQQLQSNNQVYKDTKSMLTSAYNGAEVGGEGLALLGGGVYREYLNASQGKGFEPLQTASKQWLSMKGSKQNMETVGKIYPNLIPVLGGLGHLAKHSNESTGAKLVDVGEVALSVLPFADEGLGTGLSLTKMAVTGGIINVGVGEAISKFTTGKFMSGSSLKTNAVEGGLMGVAGGLGGMGLGAGLAKAGLGSGLAAKALGGAAVNTALTLPFSRNPTQLMESAAFGAAMGVAPDLITAAHANLDEALGTGTIAKEAGTTLGKEGPATVYETQSELADIGKVRIIGDVTENPASAEELANEYVGRTVTSTHMTPSDEMAAFGAKSGSKLLLKGMNEGVSGSRASSDLLNFYKAPANLEGEATTYGGYAGIGKGEEYSLSLKGSGKASMLVFNDEHITDFGIKPGESPEDYIARINTEGAGKTGIAQENYLGRSTERQFITPTQFEGNYGDYPGTTIESEGKIGKVWVKTGFLQYKGMDVYGAHTLGAGDLTGDLSKGNDLLSGKGNDLLGGKGLDLEKYNTDLLSSAGRHIVSPSIGNSIGSSFGSFGSRLQFGSGIKSTRTKSIGWSSAGSFGIGSRLGDMTNLSRFGRSKGIKSSGTGSSGRSKKPIGSSGKKSPGRPPSTSKGSSSHGRGTSVWSPPTGYEHGTSVWSKGSSSYIHHGITTLSIGSSGKKSSGYKRPSYTGSSITYAPPTKKRAVVVPPLYVGFGPKATLAKGKSSKRYFETKFELPDIAKSVTGHSFRNAKKWRDLL